MSEQANNAEKNNANAHMALETRVNPYDGFEEFFELSAQDSKILDGALNLNSGQSAYQSEHFVADSQLTPYRKLKQCLLELETRHHSWHNINNSLKRKLVEVKIAKRDYEACTDELQKELIAVDIEDMEHDVKVWNRKIKQAAEEVNTYLNLTKKIAGDNDELLDKAMGYDHEEERKYWVTRMAKQAAMDMVSYGRIGSGNMDSIAMMPEEDQIEALATTIQYNERLQNGLAQIAGAVNEGLLENKNAIPNYDVPSVTDKLMAKEILSGKIKDKESNVQHTPESKTGPETV
jgi:hypothetical protein